MSRVQFEWDNSKNQINIAKHNVSFEEAQTAFLDEQAMLIDDPDHSEAEERFILLGFSTSLRLLVVCHCYRQSDEVIRLISARKATQTEASQYQERK